MWHYGSRAAEKAGLYAASLGGAALGVGNLCGSRPSENAGAMAEMTGEGAVTNHSFRFAAGRTANLKIT
jgi:hypothetical protein